MKDINTPADAAVIELSKDYLSDKDKRKFKNEILSLFGALICLMTGWVYLEVFFGTKDVGALIYFAGILIIGVPIFTKAVRGLISKNMESALEMLVSIAIIMAALDGQFILAIVMPAILTLVHFLEERSIMGGHDAIEGLKKMQANTAFLYTDGIETEVDAKELKRGDIIVIKPGMSLPVDGEVVFGVSSIDQQSLTGESIPNTVTVKDQVFAGTININGIIRVKVVKEYADTSFQKIVKLLENAEHITILETKIVDKFMLYYIPLALTVTVLVWLFTQNIARAIAVLVVSCPCGHMLISSAPMIATLSVASKKGILIKNSAFVQHLSETDYIVFDKTGTITSGQLEAGGYYLDKAANLDELLTTAACVTHASLHPVSKSISAICADKEYERDYEIKEYIGKGIEGKKGDDVIYVGSGKWMRSLKFDIPDKYEDAGTCDWVVKNGQILGCVVFKDTPREDAARVMSELKDVGVARTYLLTGDHLHAAEKIQKEVGIDEMKCNLLPEDKLNMVRDMMKDHIVAVVGDGINDALALSKAHVGIAMGAVGSDTAIESADIALMNNNLANIPYAIRLAKKTKSIIYQNVILAFSISVIMIFLAGAGFVSPIAGAFLHNLGAFAILINSGRIVTQPPDIL